MKPHGSLSFVIGVVLLAHLSLPCAQAQQILQVLEPGMVLSRFVLELGDAISGISRVPSQAARSIG
jgi:hypothetical protein